MAGFLIAIISGALMSIQGAFNTNVTRASSLWATAILVQLTALITCAIMWLLDGRKDLFKVFSVDDKLCLLGGVVGAFITITVIKSVGSLGIAKAEVTIVIAQIAVSYFLELLGAFGCEKAQFSPAKAGALLLAVLGVCLFYAGGNMTTN